jgi:hypothetical protein
VSKIFQFKCSKMSLIAWKDELMLVFIMVVDILKFKIKNVEVLLRCLLVKLIINILKFTIKNVEVLLRWLLVKLIINCLFSICFLYNYVFCSYRRNLVSYFQTVKPIFCCVILYLKITRSHRTDRKRCGACPKKTCFVHLINIKECAFRLIQ